MSLELNKIICGDALEELRKLPNESIDCLITDPPYNISQGEGKQIGRKGLSYKGYRRDTSIKLDFGDWDRKTEKEFNQFTEEWLKEVTRILKPKAWGYIFFAKEKIGLLEQLYRKYNLKYRTVISWCKRNPVPSFRKVNWISATEFISVFSKGSGKLKNYLSYKEMLNYQITNTSSSYGITDHPTEKPIELISKFIKTSSYEKDIILDPFLGSGTTAVACQMLNRNYIGIDINPAYCKIAEDRLRQDILL